MRNLLPVLVAAYLSSAVLLAQKISGELKQWHDVVLVFDGPDTSEMDDPNPFVYYRLNVTFTKGKKKYLVPGYFAADGNAAETSATSGNKWRVHFVPDETGEWTYRVSFRQGQDVALAADENAGRPVVPDGLNGKLNINPSDKNRTRSPRARHPPLHRRALCALSGVGRLLYPGRQPKSGELPGLLRI